MAQRKTIEKGRGHSEAKDVAYRPIPERDRELVKKAYELFRKFASATQGIRLRIVEAERRILPVRSMYDSVRNSEKSEKCPYMGYSDGRFDPLETITDERTNTATPTLFSVCESLTADLALDVPEPVLLGREASDDELAQTMTQLLKAARERTGYKAINARLCRDAVVRGWAPVKVFWDSDGDMGRGEIVCAYWDGLAFVPDPHFEDIQDGKAVFCVSFNDRDWYAEHYPDQYPMFSGEEVYSLSSFESMGKQPVHDDNQRIGMLEYWYKKYDAKTGKTYVHMAKIAAGAVLECSEDYSPRGIYQHGQYPFVIRRLIPVPGSPFGLGLPDIYSPMQEYIDIADKATMINMLMSMRPRFAYNKGAMTDREVTDLTDWSIQAVGIEGASGRSMQEIMTWIQGAPFNNLNVQQIQSKTEMIKDLSGQNAYTRGEGGGGVTAASAIMALQDAGNKRARAYLQGFFYAETEVVKQMLELVREFYNEQRVVRVIGNAEDGRQGEDKLYREQDIARMQGNNLSANEDEPIFPHDGFPIQFDVQVSVSKGSELSILSHNETMMELFGLMANMGVPVNGLDLVKNMRFDGKEDVIKSAKESLSAQMAQLVQQLEQQNVAMQNMSAQIRAMEQHNAGQRSSSRANAEMPSGNTGSPIKIKPTELRPNNIPGGSSERMSPQRATQMIQERNQ